MCTLIKGAGYDFFKKNYRLLSSCKQDTELTFLCSKTKLDQCFWILHVTYVAFTGKSYSYTVISVVTSIFFKKCVFYSATDV